MKIQDFSDDTRKTILENEFYNKLSDEKNWLSIHKYEALVLSASLAVYLHKYKLMNVQRFFCSVYLYHIAFASDCVYKVSSLVGVY